MPSIPTVNAPQLLYMAANPDRVSVEALDHLQSAIVSAFWSNPVLLREAVRVWHHCGGHFGAGEYLTQHQYEEVTDGLADPLNCGRLIVHLSSRRVFDLPRVPCPKMPMPAILNIERLITAYAPTVSFDKTSDAFLHAILRIRLEPYRLALCADTEMPYEKISEQLTTDANDELGPIIDEPIVQRIERIDWDASVLDPELAMLAAHALVELLQIKTPKARPRRLCLDMVLVNSMMAFQDREGSFAFCSMNDGREELGFIHDGSFYVAGGPRALPAFLAAFLALCCPDDPCTSACNNPSTAPDGLVKQLLLGENA